MNPSRRFPLPIVLLIVVLNLHPVRADEARRLAELDRYWSEVSQAVGTGDFEAYRATCHPEGILVSGVRGRSSMLTEALARWKKEFDDTRAGERESSVAFRFSNRIGDDATAHETGIFRYAYRPKGGEWKVEFIHFEGLLLRKDGRWLILMENQKSVATPEEWASLADVSGKDSDEKAGL